MNENKTVEQYFDLFILPLRRGSNIDIELANDFIQCIFNNATKGIVQKNMAAKLYYFYSTYLSALSKKNSKEKTKFEEDFYFINDKLFLKTKNDIDIKEELVSSEERVNRIKQIVRDNILALEVDEGVSMQSLLKILYVYYVIERIITNEVSANPYDLINKDDPFLIVSSEITETLDKILDLETNI